MNFSIQYDPKVVSVDRISVGDLVTGAKFQSNSDRNGIITFGLVVGEGAGQHGLMPIGSYTMGT